jgi:putative nucleotidyltransferase with HDIG domain
MPDNIKTLKFPFVNHEIEMNIEDTVFHYLKEISKEDFFQSLNYIIKEMAGNANKANLKRIHFRRKNLNIRDIDEYEEGMKDFQQELNEKQDLYFSLANDMGYFVKIDLFIENGHLVILIIDNSVLLPVEIQRIRERFLKASKFNSMEEVLAEGLDMTEGGGFGIILVILMLRQMGVDERVLKIMKSSNLTRFELSIPLTLVTSEESDIIADSIAQEIQEIPQFPQHVLELQRILKNPNANFDHLSHIVKKDPALIADLLKTANSVMYALPHKVNSINEAVKLIGFKGVESLVLTYATQKLLMNNYRLDLIHNVMDHSAEVGYYASEIARLYQFKEAQDDIYIGGLLHDIGKIMVNALKPNMIDRIKTICRERGISRELMENLTNGYNHSIIGGKLAKKWNFPESLYQIIRYHHVPTEAAEGYFHQVACTYLADIFFYYRRDQALFSAVNFQVRKFFEITHKEDFESLYKKITDKFERKMEMWRS